MSNRFLRVIIGMIVILIAIWAFYNPDMAQAKWNELLPVITTKLATVSPFLILLFAKNIVRGVIDAVLTAITLYIAYLVLVHYGMIPDVLPSLLPKMIDAFKSVTLVNQPIIGRLI